LSRISEGIAVQTPAIVAIPPAAPFFMSLPQISLNAPAPPVGLPLFVPDNHPHTTPIHQTPKTNMKIKLIAMVLGAAFAAAPACFAQGANDYVRIDVRVEAKTDQKDIPNSTANTKTQHETVMIQLSGKPKSPESRTVKWYIFGKDVRSNAVKALESGEEALALSGSGQQVITKTATTTFTPDHTVVERPNNNNNNNNNNNRGNSRRVEGEGVKYVGYVVIVKDGNNIVGKASTGMELEKEAK
jgi:hypothetical protein